jgi:hypothetical protein
MLINVIVSGRPPDLTKTLLGTRFSCVEGTLLVVGPSGIGNSSASIQQHLLWSAGEPAFGITLAKPLKISTIQAEDDAGNLFEIVSGARHHLKLSSEQAALSRKNCTYYHHKSLTGHDFLKKSSNPLYNHRRHAPLPYRLGRP